MTEGLERYLAAQDGIYPRAVAEVQAGRKRSHWMWYIWPQLRGLGLSDTAQRYGIGGAAEAAAYLAHPVLGPRLSAISRVMLAHRGKPAAEVLGPVDAQKLRSSMTLFAAVAKGEPVFDTALRTFFDGQPCEKTIALLRASG